MKIMQLRMGFLAGPLTCKVQAVKSMQKPSASRLKVGELPRDRQSKLFVGLFKPEFSEMKAAQVKEVEERGNHL